MILERIKLVNFRQYKNEKVEFASDKEKNVTVIIGENSFGKTSFVSAFIWCLYRELGLNGPVLNSDVAIKLDEGQEAKVSVSLDLTHNDSEYHITTEQLFRKQNGKVDPCTKPTTKLIKDGIPFSNQQVVNQEIEYILKKDLKNYFFYDGENNRIESIGKKSSLKSAIYKMMGIDRVIELTNYFKPTSTEGIFDKLNSQIEVDNTPQLEIWKNAKNNCTKEKEFKEGIIGENNEEIEKLKNQLYETESVLSANKDIEEDQKRKLSLTYENNQSQKNVDTEFDNVLRTLNGRTPSCFHEILRAKIYEKYGLSKLPEQSSFSEEDSLSHIDEKVIDQLIKRGRCLCGAEITNENEARKHLEEAREHMSPNDYGRSLNDYCNYSQRLVDRKESTLNKISEVSEDFLNLIEKIERNKTEIKEIEERIKGRPNVGDYQKRAIEIKAQIRALELQNENIEKYDIPAYEEKIADANNHIKELSKKNRK